MERKYLFKSIICALAAVTVSAEAAVTLVDLRCEYMVNPIGINAEKPRLSWKLKSDAQNEKQTAFEVLAASRPELLTPTQADLYSSGKIEGDWSHLFPYIGKRPSGMEQVFWKVRVWDKNGEVSEWSPTAMWSYGPDAEEDWKGAQWISMDPNYLKGGKSLAANYFLGKANWIWLNDGQAAGKQAKGEAYFAKEIVIPENKQIKSAEAAFAVDDNFRFYLNGKYKGEGNTWRKLTFIDLTKDFRHGKNFVSIRAENSSPGYAGAAGVIVVVYTDGSEDIYATDGTWLSSKSVPQKWETNAMTSEGWEKKSTVFGKAGMQPWGNVNGANGLPDLPALHFRKEFVLDENKKIRSAVAHITGLGLFELYLNGQKVGNHVLDAMVTDYTKTIAFQTLDIKNSLLNGENAVGVMLGNGRYTNPRVGIHYGQPVTRMLMRVEYEDGTIQEIVTDESWMATDQGPIRFNNEFDGEIYDARMELPGWSMVGYEAEKWMKSVQLSKDLIAPGKAKAQMMPPIRVTEVIKPKSVKLTQRGTYMVDMGQNMVGFCRIKAKGPEGTTIKLVHAETLKPDGNLFMANLRSARVTDRYTMKGREVEVYQPRFVYHGFRFVEVTGYPGDMTVDDIEGCVVHDDLDRIGYFETSNPLVNQIYHNIFWGVRGNYRSMPTDCPQRDERLGWLGDRAAESEGEALLFNTAPLHSKWLRDMSDSQLENGSVSDVSPNYWKLYNDNVTWPSATIIIPNVLYRQYGDIGIIAEHYPSMKKWMDHMIKTQVKDNIILHDTYGDWCCPPESPELIHSKDPLRKTAGPVLSTTYFYGNLRLMEKYANLLNKNEDAKYWSEQAVKMKEAFIAKYYNKEKKCFDNGSQTSSVLPLFFDMIPEGESEAVFEQLVNKIMVHTKGHIGVGLVGAQYLNRVLSDYNRSDISWKLATNTDFPSWGYMVKNGATTIWELWNGDTANPGMNSHNHVMLIGDLNVWFHERLAGIRPAEPGYKKILFKPEPVKGIDYVKASLETPYGKASSHWTVKENKFVLNIEVPANTEADVILPDGNSQKVGSGAYTFEIVKPSQL